MARALAGLRRTLKAGAALLVFLILAGATYQGVATALERREFPRPGGLVPVGDYQLHLFCTGAGSPTVLLEAPAAGGSAAWSDVQPRLAATTRVCSYDRAGLGWSEAGPPFDPGRVPEELRTLLTNSEESGPYVIVGHGLGAAFARVYATRPDAEAVALVEIAPPEVSPDDGEGAWLMPASPWLARMGVLRAGRILSRKAEGLDGVAGGATRAFLNRPDHLTRAAAELQKWNDAVARAAGTSLPANVPAITVDAGSPDRVSFLSDPADIDGVVAAIEAAITTSRGSSEAP